MAVTKARGLSADELEKIRAGLDAGRRPKVMFNAAAGQVAGQLGQVVALTDPGVTGDWVVVRFGRDELPSPPATCRCRRAVRRPGRRRPGDRRRPSRRPDRPSRNS